MARIVDLGELLPEDISFQMGDTAYLAPGDPPLELILKIASLFERASNSDGDDAAGLEVMQDLDAAVLGLFQIRTPALVKSPFGVQGIMFVVAEMLKQYGFAAEDEAEADDADPPGPAGSRPPSRRSSGSRSSAKSSTSRRRTGTA